MSFWSLARAMCLFDTWARYVTARGAHYHLPLALE